MVSSILFLFYFSIKIILSKNLNEIIYFYQLQNTGDEIRQELYKKNNIPLFILEDESKEFIKNLTIRFLEQIRDEPKSASEIFNNYMKPYINKKLDVILKDNNVSFLYNLTKEILMENNTFFNDSFIVI